MPLCTIQKNVTDHPEELIDTEGFARICKALGHPVRVKIIRYLKKADRCVCKKIVEVLPLSQSTVSQHLKILKEAGLIQGEIEGPRTCYCLNPNVVARFAKMVQTL